MIIKIKTYEKEKLEFFPLYTCTICIDYIQERVVRPLGFEFNQVFIVSEGSGIVEVNGETHPVYKNDLFYIASDTPHKYFGCSDDFHTSFLSFLGNGFDAIKKYYNTGDFGVYHGKNMGHFESHLTKLYEKFEDIYETSTLCAHTFSCIIAFFDEACRKEYSPIETVYNYIENNYSKPISLEDILTFYPHSKSKLCRDFKAKYGLSIFDALTKIRLKNAHNMIKSNPYVRLGDIAASCGFNDTSYFCKMYKRKYGFSPKESIN